MSAAINMIPGDRATPRLPVQAHLRAGTGRAQPTAPVPGCPLFSRIDGRMVPVGCLTVEEASAALVAGEA